MPSQTPAGEAFERFFTQYYPLIHSYCLSRRQSPSDADEITSEAMFRLSRIWDQRGHLPDAENLKWLYLAARNIIHEYRKANAKYTTTEKEHPEAADETNVEFQVVEEEQYSFYLREIQKRLNQEERQLFMMAFAEKMPYSEIRKKLSLGQTALDCRLYRLRKKIKSYVNELLTKHK